MKKTLSTLSLILATCLNAQFSSGAVNLGTTGMTVKLDTTPSAVTITLTGSSSSYLGIGFGNSGMANGADGFIYNSSANRDYTFSGVGITPTADAVQDWTETSNTVSAGTRTVVATRSLSGGPGDKAIANASGSVNIFYSRGPGTALSSGYHGAGNRGYATLNMSPTLAVDNILAEKSKITLYPNPARETVYFKNADKIKSVEIYDSSGKKLRSEKINATGINITDFKSGIYYLEITLIDGNINYEKLIKE